MSARLALEGLSLGDAFGERFFWIRPPEETGAHIAQRVLPRGPWKWTDDTAMAISIVEALEQHGGIEPDLLANAFARRFADEPDRGYGGGARELLISIGLGTPWDVAAQAAFGGQGSMGNGAAMRAAPIGAHFASDLQRVITEATRSAVVTHAHPDGQAGAVAVAVAAALCARGVSAGELLEETTRLVPAGATRDGLARAVTLSSAAGPEEAARLLGSGRRVLSSDTVPFALWCAAQHLDDFEACLWATVAGLGDRDTTCAIAGAVVALRVGLEGLPARWLRLREPLPD